MPSKNTAESNLRNKVYYAAKAELIEKHQEEYRELLLKHAEEAGVTLQIRKTPEEKAEEQLQELLEKFPHLQAKVEPVEEQPA